MSASDFTPASGIPSLSGKIVLVTGGSSGLGLETVLQLAKHEPAKIYMAARNESKARAAIKSIESDVPNSCKLEFLSIDTSSVDSVSQAARTFTSAESRLDILVLNAGILATPPSQDVQGHDLQLSTNHIGHHLLTRLLLPTLERTAAAAAEPDSDVRVVSIASTAYNMAPDIDTILSPSKLNATGPWARYGASKAANILFAAELARRHPKLTSVSVHPGMIKTDLLKYDDQSHSFFKYSMLLFGRFLYRDIAHGACNQLWAAAGAKKTELLNGCFYMPVGKAKPGNKYVKDVEAGRRLWEWTEGELAKAGH